MKIQFLRFLFWVYGLIRSYQLRNYPARWSEDDERVYREAERELKWHGY